MVSFLGKGTKEEVKCQFCGGLDGDGHLFWERTFLPILHVRELPEFAPLLARDRSNRPRCLLWHGLLLGLGVAGERDPWAASLGQLAARSLEQRLGAYPADDSGLWTPLTFGLLRIWLLRNYPCVWTDGSREDYPTCF